RRHAGDGAVSGGARAHGHPVRVPAGGDRRGSAEGGRALHGRTLLPRRRRRGAAAHLLADRSPRARARARALVRALRGGVPLAPRRRAPRARARGDAPHLAGTAPVNEVVEYPWALLGAPAFALAIALLFWLAFRRRAKRIARLGTAPLITRL